MAQIRCCVCDLDGTLLNPQNKINPGDRDALMRFQENGGYVVIATGRTDLQFKEYIHELNIQGPVIACNGGYVIDTRDNSRLRMHTYAPEDIRRLVAFCREKELDHMLYLPDYVYYAHGSRRVRFYENYNLTTAPEHRVPLRCVDEISDDELFSCTIKLLVIGTPELKCEIEKTFCGDIEFTAVMSGTDLIDIMPGISTTKGDGVRLISEKLGIPLESIAVFGDSPNDASMFRVAGFPIAMGNAVDEIKALAGYITLPNTDEGIRHALEHFNAI